MDEPKILFENADFLLLNKPAGWVTNDAESVSAPTVQQWLRKLPIAQLSNYQLQTDRQKRQGIVHRLDKETSGVLVVAKNVEMLVELQRQFRERLTRKTYVALVHGRLEPSKGEMALPLARSRMNRQKFTVRVDGKMAQTAWQVEQYLEKNGEVFSLLTLFPKTGRTHQLRVHLAHLKHSIVADPLYSPTKKLTADTLWCPRLFLHARELCFEYQSNVQCFQAELAEELQNMLKTLNSKL